MNAYLYSVLGVTSWQHETKKLHYVPNIPSSEWQFNSARIKSPTSFNFQEKRSSCLHQLLTMPRKLTWWQVATPKLSQGKNYALRQSCHLCIPTAYTNCKYRPSLSLFPNNMCCQVKEEAKKNKKKRIEAMPRGAGECTRRLHNLAR